MESFSITTPKTKEVNARGTDLGAIATRLETFYGNLHPSSPTDVKANPSQNNRDPRPYPNESHVVSYLDENNNVCFLPASELPGQPNNNQY